ncbi:MAG: hypothetical protein V4459_11045 [Pseudomonadota bacterium]
MSGFTTAERAALDRVTVPAMRDGFAAGVVSAALASGPVAPRRDARSGWRRHGRVIVGAGALFLASATAAATGWLGKLPIHIPGITRAAPEPEATAKPKRVVRAERPRPAPGVALAAPMAAPTPDPLPPQPTPWQLRRAERIAAGLPVRRPLVQRAIAERLRAMPPEQRKAAVAEWRRIRELPPTERKAAMARIRGDYLARHPKLAARVEQGLERKSADVAAAGDPPKALPDSRALPFAARPQPQLSPQDRAERRERRRAWRQWRAQREGTPPPVR